MMGISNQKWIDELSLPMEFLNKRNAHLSAGEFQIVNLFRMALL
jgi:hypothetical protein